MSIAVSDMADIVISTLNSLYSRGTLVDQMTDLQEHVGFNELLKNKKERLSAGRGIPIRAVVSPNGSAKNTGLYGTQEYNKSDALIEGSVPWRFTSANMVFDSMHESMNSGPEAILDEVKIEKARMMTDLVELCERNVWGVPDNSADSKTPYGVEYWLVKNATLGFNGGNPTGFTAGRAGIDSNTYTRNKNYTGKYTTVGDTVNTGLINMMEQAADKTDWIAPAPLPQQARTGYSRGIFCNHATKMEMKNVAKANNDSLGYDLSTKEPIFRGATIRYVPYFDSKTDGPVYMIDFNNFYPVILKEWFLKDIQVTQLPNQPTCFAMVTMLVWNIVCTNLRRQVVFYK